MVLEKLLVLLTSVCDRAGTGYLQSTAGLWHLLRASKCFTIGNECVSGPNSTNGISTQGRHPGSGVCLQPSKAQLALGGVPHNGPSEGPSHPAPFPRVPCLTEEISRCKPRFFKDQSVLDICIILIRFYSDLSWHRHFCCHIRLGAGLLCSHQAVLLP